MGLPVVELEDNSGVVLVEAYSTRLARSGLSPVGKPFGNDTDTGR